MSFSLRPEVLSLRGIWLPTSHHHFYLSRRPFTMPSQPSKSTRDARAKRRRETSSQVSEVSTAQSTTNVDSASAAGVEKRGDNNIARKRRKDDAGDKPKKKGSVRKPGTHDTPFTLSDSEPSAIGSDRDEGASAVKASARTAAHLAGLQATDGRRARFAQRFSGCTPEKTLRMFHLLVLVCSYAADKRLSVELSKGWRSPVYKHFLDPVIVKGPNGATVHRFTCKKFVLSVSSGSLSLLTIFTGTRRSMWTGWNTRSPPGTCPGTSRRATLRRLRNRR